VALISSNARRDVQRAVARAVLQAARRDRVTLIGIDGVDGAGKSCFADELAPLVAATGRPVIRATVDGFHRPRAERYARGRESPDGFYRDSYDYTALKRSLLDPIRAGRPFRRTVFDLGIDQPVTGPEETTPNDAVLLFDGIFLHRHELVEYWDLSIYLDVPWEMNHHLPGHPEWNRPRYSEGQAIYIKECSPQERATIVIDNTDLAQPRVTAWRHHS
jgi:uridine kinase